MSANNLLEKAAAYLAEIAAEARARRASPVRTKLANFGMIGGAALGAGLGGVGTDMLNKDKPERDQEPVGRNALLGGLAGGLAGYGADALWNADTARAPMSIGTVGDVARSTVGHPATAVGAGLGVYGANRVRSSQYRDMMLAGMDAKDALKNVHFHGIDAAGAATGVTEKAKDVFDRLRGSPEGMKTITRLSDAANPGILQRLSNIRNPFALQNVKIPYDAPPVAPPAAPSTTTHLVAPASALKTLALAGNGKTPMMTALGRYGSRGLAGILPALGGFAVDTMLTRPTMSSWFGSGKK